MKTPNLTTSNGMPVDDNQNSLTAGEYGPVLIQDYHLIDKLAKFDRERIPERVVHAKGSGAHGILKITQDISKYCRAGIFKDIGKEINCFMRFSTVGGEQGTSDSDRDPRGFAIKFYTEEGNWDIVGNNTPVFFIRDPIKFPDFIHSVKRDPKNGLKNPTHFWDFISHTPESIHQIMILFSNHGTPRGYRYMHGYGSHTFKWINNNNEGFFVKYHFKTNQGVKNFTDEESVQMRGLSPDFARKDLYEAISKKEFPSWTFCVQIMPEKEAANYKFNIFDVTKIWPHKDFPLIEVGILTLNRNPENFFAEVEQAAFTPANMLPGIEPSFDKMLQGRLFSYNDTHRHRLGGNFDLLPINCPYKAKINNNIRDGFLNSGKNGGSQTNYEPSSFNPTSFNPMSKISPSTLKGTVGRYKPNHPNDDFLQPRNLYNNVMNDYEKDHLIKNLVNDLKQVPKNIQQRQLNIFYKVDVKLAKRLAEQLKLPALTSSI